MKKAGALVSSVAAASSVALPPIDADNKDQLISGREKKTTTASTTTATVLSDKGKFAPRFDGLKFIETLVTAHR